MSVVPQNVCLCKRQARHGALRGARRSLGTFSSSISAKSLPVSLRASPDASSVTPTATTPRRDRGYFDKIDHRVEAAEDALETNSMELSEFLPQGKGRSIRPDPDALAATPHT